MNLVPYRRVGPGCCRGVRAVLPYIPGGCLPEHGRRPGPHAHTRTPHTCHVHRHLGTLPLPTHVALPYRDTHTLAMPMCSPCCRHLPFTASPNTHSTQASRTPPLTIPLSTYVTLPYENHTPLPCPYLALAAPLPLPRLHFCSTASPNTHSTDASRSPQYLKSTCPLT